MFYKYSKNEYSYEKIYENLKKHKTINLTSFDEVKDMLEYFDIDNKEELKVFETYSMKNYNIRYANLSEFLTNNNFIIVK